MKNPCFSIYALYMGIFSLLLVACNFPGNSEATATPTTSGILITYAAETISARITSAVTTQPIGLTNEPTSTELQPSETDIVPSASVVPPSNTVRPINTSTPVPTPTETPCNHYSFVNDVNIPDETVIQPGVTFTKTWRLRNTGSCDWTTDYSLAFEKGDAMGAPATVPIASPTITFDQEVDISVILVAPDDPGEYQGFFKLRDPDGELFGWGNDSKAFWVLITVPDSSGVMFDFISLASSADWGSGVTPIDFTNPGHITLTFGGPDNDANGFAMIKDSVLMENGGTSGKIIETHPKWEDDGYIVGRYPEYKISSGDKIEARLGFIAINDGSCGLGDATFQINYTLGDDLSTLTKLISLSKTCDKSLTKINVDLTSLAGKTVRFYIIVKSNGSSAQDWAIWSSLGVMR